jgi:hypothetical protein
LDLVWGLAALLDMRVRLVTKVLLLLLVSQGLRLNTQDPPFTLAMT